MYCFFSASKQSYCSNKIKKQANKISVSFFLPSSGQKITLSDKLYCCLFILGENVFKKVWCFHFFFSLNLVLDNNPVFQKETKNNTETNKNKTNLTEVENPHLNLLKLDWNWKKKAKQNKKIKKNPKLD